MVWVTPPSPPAVGRAQETLSTGVTLPLLCCITCFENGAGGNPLLVQVMGSLVSTLFQPCLVLCHSQGRNTKHFHSSAVCAELTSGQSLWLLCKTVTASHHTIRVSERRDVGQVLFFPQQHIFQGSPIKMTRQRHVESFPDTHGLMGKLRSTQMVQAFLTSHLSTWPVMWEQNSLVVEGPSNSSPNHPRAPSIRNGFHRSRLCNFAWSRNSHWLG